MWFSSTTAVELRRGSPRCAPLREEMAGDIHVKSQVGSVYGDGSGAIVFARGISPVSCYCDPGGMQRDHRLSHAARYATATVGGHTQMPFCPALPAYWRNLAIRRRYV